MWVPEGLPAGLCRRRATTRLVAVLAACAVASGCTGADQGTPSASTGQAGATSLKVGDASASDGPGTGSDGGAGSDGGTGSDGGPASSAVESAGQEGESADPAGGAGTNADTASAGGSDGATASDDATVSDGATASEGATASGASGGAAAGDGPIYLTDTPDWKGGMIGSAGLMGTTATVTGWLPGMADVATCELELWEDDEFPPTDAAVQANIDVRATTGDEPTAAIVYSATTKASGLTPEETHVYLSTLELDGCTIGERVDLLGGPIDKDAYAPAPEFVGATDDVLAVQPYPTIVGELPEGPALLGIRPGTGEIVWETPNPGGSIEVRPTESGPGTVVEKVIDLELEPADGDSVRSLVDVATGENLVEAEDFEPPWASLGPDSVLYTIADKRPYVHRIHRAGQSKDITVDGGFFDSGATIQSGDGAGGVVMVGLFEADEDADPALGVVAADGTVTEILPAATVDDLQLEILGVSAGNIYARTTAENIVIDLAGEQVGEAYDDQQYPYVPMGERTVGGSSWTLWELEPGEIGGNESPAVITENGEFPPRDQ